MHEHLPYECKLSNPEHSLHAAEELHVFMLPRDGKGHIDMTDKNDKRAVGIPRLSDAQVIPLAVPGHDGQPHIKFLVHHLAPHLITTSSWTSR